MTELQPLAVPDTRSLFAPLRAGLVALLRTLEPADWTRPTVAGAWCVRDVAAHLLDGELRTLAAHRDGHDLSAGAGIRNYGDVLALIGRLNAEGVTAGRHLSATLLIDLLAVSGEWMHAFLAGLDLDARALFPVAWAGEMESTNRFDTAREFTERWHHEMQIRAAVFDRGDPNALLAEQFGVPLIETALRALPHTYRESTTAEGATLVIDVDAPAWKRSYSMRRDADTWQLYAGGASQSAARVAASVDAWWRLFFNAIPIDDAEYAFAATGAPELVAPLWGARSVMV